MLEFPLTVHLDIVVFVAGREPSGAIPFAEGEWSKEIPDASGVIAVDFDSWIHHIVLREADTIAKAFEQLADRGMAPMRADAIAFPHAIIREQFGDLIRVVIVVTHGAVARLELLDRFDVFQNGDALLESVVAIVGPPRVDLALPLLAFSGADARAQRCLLCTAPHRR